MKSNKYWKRKHENIKKEPQPVLYALSAKRIILANQENEHLNSKIWIRKSSNQKEKIDELTLYVESRRTI